MKKFLIWIVVGVAVVGAALWLRNRLVRCRPPQLTVIDDPAQLDDLHLDLRLVDGESWVRRYNPKKANAGPAQVK